MELVERYIQEVGTYLPKDLRDDVARELRSNLAAALESRRKSAPAETESEIEVAVLKELGPPHEFAETQVPKPRVLFGPRLYPPFIHTLRVSIGVLAALATLAVVMDFIQSKSLVGLGRSLVSAFSSLVTGSLVILGIAVVVFAIIERTAATPPKPEEDWDPRSLPKSEDPDKISLGDQVASISFLIVALVVVNLFRDRVGALVTLDDESGWVPLLGPNFDAQLWLLNLALSLDLAINLLALWRHRWSWMLRWSNFGVNCLYVVWIWLLVSGPPFLAADPDLMIQAGWSVEAAAEYSDFVETNFARWVHVNLWLAFVAACGGLAYSFFKILRRLFAQA